MFAIKRDDVYVLFACAKEISINPQVDKIETKTVGDGYWKKYAYKAIGYNIDLSSVLKFDDVDWTGWDFLDNMLQFVTVAFQMIFTDSTTGQQKRLRGNLLIENITFTASASDVVMSDITLPGTGALEISNPADDCFATITSITLVTYGGHRYIRISGHTGSVGRYDYAIDGGGYVTVFPVSFIPDLVLPDDLTTGDHNISIIPYCASNNNPGIEFTGTFNVPAIYEVHGRVETGGVTDACGGALAALWGTFGVGNILYTDEAMTVPATGYDFIIKGVDIYGFDNATGEILADTGSNCASAIKSNQYRLKTTVDATCSQPLTRLYTSGAFGVGAFMFYDAAMTIPVTGATRIVRGVQIHNIDFDTGQVGTNISVCPNGSPDDYIVSVGADICDSPIVLYYTTTPFAVGVIVYTDAGVSIPLTTYDEFANADTGIIYNMDDTTGEVLTPTGVDCNTPYVEVIVKLGNDSSTVCDGFAVSKYVSTAFAPGETLFNDISLADPTVGYAFVVGPDGHIYNLNSSTGLIGSDTGTLCGATDFDMDISKEVVTDDITIFVTDTSVGTTKKYTFNENDTDKNFPAVFIAGHLYDIQVTCLVTRTITIQDGIGAAVATGTSTTVIATGVNPATAGVNITIVS